jgi:hypothetical protein
MKKPGRLAPVGLFSSAEGKSDGGLESFSGDEFDSLRGFDLDLRTRLRIHASAGLAVADLEGAKADELNGLGFFDSGLDAVDHGVDGALGVGLAGIKGFLNGCDEFDFVHVFFVLG